MFASAFCFVMTIRKLSSENQLTKCSWLQINAGRVHIKKRTFNWFFQVDLRVIIMQINRLYLLSVHSCKEGFLWMEAVVMETLLTLPPLRFFSDFSFWFNIFTVCSTREFSSRQPPTSAALRIWGPLSAFSPFKKNPCCKHTAAVHMKWHCCLCCLVFSGDTHLQSSKYGRSCPLMKVCVCSWVKVIDQKKISPVI